MPNLDINAWFASRRKTPTSHGKVRGERTIQTYARSACAFFQLLVHREIIARNPFDRVVFPKVGRPLISVPGLPFQQACEKVI